MPDLRKDPIVGRWVIIAKNRAKRPHDLVDTDVARPHGQVLPFLRRERTAHARRDRRLSHSRARIATGPAGGCASCPTSFRRWRSKAT